MRRRPREGSMQWRMSRPDEWDRDGVNSVLSANGQSITYTFSYGAGGIFAVARRVVDILAHIQRPLKVRGWVSLYDRLNAFAKR